MEKLGFFTGAGFSRWSIGLPVANDLFNFNGCGEDEEDQEIWNIVKQVKGAWDNQNPHGSSEEFISFALSLRAKERRAIIKFIELRLSEPFIVYNNVGRRRTVKIEEKVKWDIRGIKKTRDFVHKIVALPISGIVTTNYDFLMELILESEGFNYGLLGERMTGGRKPGPYYLYYQKPALLNGGVPYAKIHGSLSWDKNNRYSDSRCGLKGNAIIVPPGIEKEPNPYLKEVWSLAEEILTNSTSLIIFGYSLNPYDVHVQRLLIETRDSVNNILIIDTKPNMVQAHRIWPRAQISGCPPPPLGSAAINRWLKSMKN